MLFPLEQIDNVRYFEGWPQLDLHVFHHHLVSQKQEGFPVDLVGPGIKKDIEVVKRISFSKQANKKMKLTPFSFFTWCLMYSKDKNALYPF